MGSSILTMNELNTQMPHKLSVGELITSDLSNDKSVRDELGHWRSTYDQTYHYDDPNAFNKPIVYTELPCIQNPGKKCVDSYKFLPGYIPKLMYCRPPGHIRNAPQALGLGCFNKVNLPNNVKMKPIQRGIAPSLRRADAFRPDYRHLTSNMTAEEELKFNYHNLVKNSRNEGLNLTTNSLCTEKLHPSDIYQMKKIYHPAVWTTSTERSHLQAAIPMSNKRKVGTEMENNSDSVRYKATRYNVNSEPWQEFSTKWDRVQARHVCHEDDKDEKKLRKNQKENEEDQNRDNSEPTDLVPHSENRQLPGYSGYVPRLPIIKGMHQAYSTTEPDTVSNYCRTTTSMQRSFPKYATQKQRSPFARKGTMSSMVTLVAPHNPFRLDKDEKGTFYGTSN